MNLLKLVSKRKIFVWVLTIVVVLGLAVTAYFVIPKFSADTLTRTITVSGVVSDYITTKRIAGARIAIETDSKTVPIAYATTDKNGSYTLKIKIDPTDPRQTIIEGRATASGYAAGNLWESIGSTDTLTINITTSKIPVDIVSNKKLDSVSARCRTSQDPQSFDSWIHNGDYKGKVVNGVLFCARASEAVVLDNYNNDIKNAASQIKKLVASTGLGFTPTVYLTGDIVWGESTRGAFAYTPNNGQEIVIDVRFLNDLSIVTHEFGHLVDWARGWDQPVKDSTCEVNIARTKAHCISSNDDSFTYAAQIARQQIISGYAASKHWEMFAEMFASLELPDSPGSSTYSLRQNTQVKITNALLEKSRTSLNGIEGSVINLPANPAQQNAAMYLYKFVAQKAHLDQYFPGSLGLWSYTQIFYGKYMSTAFLSVKVSENNQPVNNLNVTIGNGSGAPMALGTLTMKNVTVGKNVPTALSLPGLNYSPAKVNLIQGSNPVIDISTIPKATVSPPTNITTSSATLSGTATGVIHSDSVATRGFKYWKNPDPKNDPNCGRPPVSTNQVESVHMGSGTGNFSFTFGQQASPASPPTQPLYADTSYCYGAYAFGGKDLVAPALSNLMSFKTLRITVVNWAANPVAQTTATLRGHVDKPVDNQFFLYGINPDPVGDPSCSKYVESYNPHGVNATNSNGDLAAPLTGLTPNTNYCYSAQIMTIKDLVYAKSPDGKKVWQVFKTTP